MKNNADWKLLLLASFVGSSPPALAQRQANTVFASVGWSEWCPPGFVQIDLDNGDFKWIAQMPRLQCQKAASRPYLEGQLARDKFNAIREAVRRADKDGLRLPECVEGKPAPHAVVSNAGPPYILVVSTPTSSESAPTELGCWSRSALDLQRLMERTFDLRVKPTEN
jgi:hypothetical protein